jgi:hypothetical protein
LTGLLEARLRIPRQDYTGAMTALKTVADEAIILGRLPSDDRQLI